MEFMADDDTLANLLLKCKSKTKKRRVHEIADDETLASILSKCRSKRKRPPPPPPPTTAAALPYDLVVAQIFLRLDFRSVIRCAAVCKRWHSLVHDTSPAFDTFYTQHNRSVPQQKKSIMVNFTRRHRSSAFFDLLGKDAASAWWRDLSCVPDYKYSAFRASSGDLMLISRSQRRYCIMNAFTKRLLPLPKVPFPMWKPLGYALVRRPGHSPRGGGYRVVLLRPACFRNRSYECPVAVFDPETGLWSDSVVVLRCQVRQRIAAVSAYNASLLGAVDTGGGVVHWLVVGSEGICGLAAFDPFSLEHRLIPLPSRRFGSVRMNGVRDKVHVGVVRGTVRISLKWEMESHYDFKIWELDSGNEESWRLKYGFRIRKTDRSAGLFFVVCFDPDDGRGVFCVSGMGIYRYAICKRKIKPPSRIGWFRCDRKTVDKMRLNLGRYLRVLTIVHPTWPTPISSMTYPTPESKEEIAY